MLPKDLLNIIFWELTDGHDMLNFSEISRKCYQIFQQYIQINYSYCQHFKLTMMIAKNNYHGLIRMWNKHVDTLVRETNYRHGKMHGLCRGWYPSGVLWYHDNYYQNMMHGLCFIYHQGQIESISYFMGNKCLIKWTSN